MKSTIINKGTLLFRCALTSEPIPTIRQCLDTDKSGVYMTNNVKLAELICLEHSEHTKLKEFITTYEVIEDILLCFGKYESEFAHYDDSCIYPVLQDEKLDIMCYNIISKEDTVAEIFLTEKEIPKIFYKNHYAITADDVIKKYSEL